MEFVIGDNTFIAEKMDVFKQFHVLRRVAPLFPSVAGAQRIPDKILGYGFIAKALSALSDADSDFVIGACISSCKIRQGTILSPLAAGGKLMHENIDLEVLLRVTWNVLEYNIGPFIRGVLLLVFEEEAPKESA